MKNISPTGTVYWLMMQVMFQAKHRMHEIAEKHGLTMMQSNTLVMLKESEPLAMRVLSNNFMCDASNVTGLTDRLEALSLVERQDHLTDRRIKLIALTDKGAMLRELIIAEIVAAEEVRLDPILSKGEQKILQELLQKIVNTPTEKPA